MIPLLLSCHPTDGTAGLGGFAAAELQRAGHNVRLDTRPLDGAARFWPPVHSAISNKLRAAAWAVLLSDTIALDPPSLETLAYAVAGADGTRGAGFPVIALRPGSSAAAMPPALSRMQQVSMADPSWAAAVRALSEGSALSRGAVGGAGSRAATGTETFAVSLHHRGPGTPGGRATTALEFRPVNLTWQRFFVAVPSAEKGSAALGLVHGVRGFLPDLPGGEGAAGAGMSVGPSPAPDGGWAGLQGEKQANRRESYYLICGTVPTAVRFGVPGGHLQYTLRLRPI